MKKRIEKLIPKSENNNNSKGFTLIETMVVVVVFTVVMSLAMGVFLISIRSQRVALSNQKLSAESVYALNRIEEKIKNGENVGKDDFGNYLPSVIKDNDFSFQTFPASYYPLSPGERVTISTETKIGMGVGSDEQEREIVLRLQTTVVK